MLKKRKIGPFSRRPPLRGKRKKSQRHNFYIHFRVLFKGYNNVFGEKGLSCTFLR